MAEGGRIGSVPTTTNSSETAKTTTSTTTALASSGPLLTVPPVDTSYELPRMTTGRPYRLQTLDDVRVGWVYTLLKPQLIQECKYRNLDSSGRSDDLRARLVAHLRTPTEQNYNVAFEPPSDTGAIPKKNRNPPQTEADELQSVKEILGLTPDVDFRTLTLRLATLLHQEKLLAHETYIHTRPPVSPSEEEWTRAHPTDLYGTRTRSFPKPEVPRRTMEPPRFRERIESDLSRPGHYRNLTDGFHEEREDQERPASTANICNLVRKWNLRFDGREDPISFLERLNELIESYELAPNGILRSLPEIFKGNALLWWRNNRELWRNFEDFVHDFELQYLPPGYNRNLDKEIQDRTQGERETCRDFVVAISTLIRRRGGHAAREKLDRIYANLRPDYKFYIRREQLRNLTDLVQRAEEYESLLRDRSTYRPPPSPAQAMTPETAYQGRGNRRNEVNEQMYLQGMFPPISRSQETYRPREHNKSKGELVDSPWRPFQRYHQGQPTKFVNNQQLYSRTFTTQRPASTPKICWNCDEEGHSSRECKKLRRIRCFNCKTEGQLTTSCSKCSGNGNGALRMGSR
jgi:hypothetical protein